MSEEYGGTVEVQPEMPGPVAPGSEGEENPQGQPQEDGEGDELILGKFKSQEDLAKAYQELESKLGGSEKSGDDESESAPDEDKLDIENQQEEAEEALKVAGLEMGEFTKEFWENGQLGEESYKKLEEAGFPKAVVDTYIQGLQAGQVVAQQTVREIQESVGGPEAYRNITQWAGANLSQAEIDSFNAITGSNNPDLIKMAVAGLKARYDAYAGSNPKLVSGRSKGAEKGDVFRSTAELTKAMSDPRYQEDDAYRREVAEKLARSEIL